MRCASLPFILVTFLSPPYVLAAGHEAALFAESDNFRIHSYRNGPHAAELATRVEKMRSELQSVWLTGGADTQWQPRCEIVLHPTRAKYQQAVGGGAQTSGSSFIRYHRGRMQTRRIDLLVFADGTMSALPHELTHVVLADRFKGRQPPRWVDEGVATLADSHEKRRLHHRDCQSALSSGKALRMMEILNLDQFTSAEQVPAFYGQSLVLVRFLASRDDLDTIIDFAETAMDDGYNRALQTHYGIESVATLERQWRTYAKTATHSKRHFIKTAHHQ